MYSKVVLKKNPLFPFECLSSHKISEKSSFTDFVKFLYFCSFETSFFLTLNIYEFFLKIQTVTFIHFLIPVIRCNSKQSNNEQTAKMLNLDHKMSHLVHFRHSKYFPQKAGYVTFILSWHLTLHNKSEKSKEPILREQCYRRTVGRIELSSRDAPAE